MKGKTEEVNNEKVVRCSLKTIMKELVGNRKTSLRSLNQDIKVQSYHLSPPLIKKKKRKQK